MPTTKPKTTTAAATLSSATHRSAAPTVSTHGILAVSTTVSSTMSGRRTSSASRELPAVPSCHTRTQSVSRLESTSIWATSVRFTRFAAGRSGSSCVLCSGMGGRRYWSRRIARRGMRSCRGVQSNHCQMAFECMILFDLVNQ